MNQNLQPNTINRGQLAEEGRTGNDKNELPVRSLYRYVSPSRLNLWLTCPLAFKFKYVDGIFPPASPGLFLGKQVHDGLNLYYLYRKINVTLACSDVIQHLTENWDETAQRDRVVFQSLDEEAKLKKQVVELIRAYLAALPPEEPLPLAVGKTWSVPLIDPSNGEDLGMSLLGIVDLVLDAPGGPVIADFKTTARGGAPLEVMHEIQLGSYAYLFRNATVRQEAALEVRNLVRTKTPKIACFQYPPRSGAHFRRLFAAVRMYLEDLRAGRFVFRPGFSCNICDFRHTHCGDWSGLTSRDS